MSSGNTGFGCAPSRGVVGSCPADTFQDKEEEEESCLTESQHVDSSTGSDSDYRDSDEENIKEKKIDPDYVSRR